MVRHRVKLTVVKRVTPEHVFDGKVPVRANSERYTVCGAFKDGDEFIVDKRVRCPEGFCSYAWKDIFSDVRVLSLGGDHEPWVDKPFMYSCCTDGIRPVVFKLEQLED
ncbi:MAG: TIGR04076 family protein [Candidatus Heimdallarchaeota archaeon]|nr:TIGR04076 family protein [Candidatus Heimdallarchaeota archaeon]MCK4291440.1 TIGR04076 family protein [Candidatus Heimdallarchaeota archaeon]MCK5299283.1 TIGR04076 family protein [Candidatus Heimdallarchaeota archaeon]